MKRNLYLSALFLFLLFPRALAQDNFIYAENGRLYHPNGEEVALWGVNLQPCLSWEYNNLLRRVGLEKDTATLHRVTNESLDELELLGSRLIRCHLTPADFTDDAGNLVGTVFLDALDYMMAEAARREMYLYITFLNHMGSGEVYNSFMHGDRKARAKWIHDEEFVDKSKNYITQLLNRKNPYSGIQYKADTAVAVWEIINEPGYLKYQDMAGSQYEKPYKKWLRRKRLADGEASFAIYRKDYVLDYINGMYKTVRKTGAKQPVSWCCNWHRMIIGHEDVFDAIAESKVEAVSFCNYPGQSVCKHPYQENPENLTRHDYSDWYVDCYEKKEYYGWALTPPFQKKAKIVYEFETFYNQSAYLYPVMADFFRAMGVQMAAMWHYSMPAYARYRRGSHVLNLKCTPEKAASFAVAGRIFEETPLLQPYHTESTTEWSTSNYAYSYRNNISVFSDSSHYCSSGNILDSCSVKPRPTLKHIFGCGSSPLVEYSGNGIYTVSVSDHELDILLQPDVKYLIELWDSKDRKRIPATLFVNEEFRTMKVHLEGWDTGDYTLFEIVGDKKVRMGTTRETSFFAKPGHYRVVRKK